MRRFFLWLLLVLDRLSLWIETMANSYYTPSGQPTSASRGRSINLREEFALIEDAFDAIEDGVVTDGVVFPATQVPSANANTLDDYEEGEFTPAFSASGSTFSYLKQVGRYTKIGNKVTCWGSLVLNGSGNTLSANNLVITGLPFAAKNGDAYINQPAVMDWAQFDTALVNLFGVMLPTATFLSLKYLTAAGVSALTLTASRMSTTAGTYVGFSITYDTD